MNTLTLTALTTLFIAFCVGRDCGARQGAVDKPPVVLGASGALKITPTFRVHIGPPRETVSDGSRYEPDASDR